MAAKRDHIGNTIKLASCLLTILRIPYEHAKLMTAAQIVSLANFDHYPIRKADGGTDHPSNLVPMTIMAHRKKTAEQDVPQMRKADRLAKAKAALDTLMATGKKPPLPRGRRIARRSNPWPPKGSRPLRSRSSFERRVP